MNMLTWTAVDHRTWRARSASREYVVRRDDTGTWTLDGPGRTWGALPSLEIAQEVAALADEVHHDDDRMTSYRVVTATGARRGEPFGAETDEDALDVLRARRRPATSPSHRSAWRPPTAAWSARGTRPSRSRPGRSATGRPGRSDAPV